MFPLLSTLGFAAYATAQLTTTAWLPGAAGPNQTFLASVVAKNADRTTLSLSFDNGPVQAQGYFTSPPDKVTIQGGNFVAYAGTAYDAGATDTTAATVSVQCSRSSASASARAETKCTLSTAGAQVPLSQLCAAQATTSPVPACTDMPSLVFEQTMTFRGDAQLYFNDFQVVITAGVEKLGATAVAQAAQSVSRTGSVARVTGALTAGSAAASSKPLGTVPWSANAAGKKLGSWMVRAGAAVAMLYARLL